MNVYVCVNLQRDNIVIIEFSIATYSRLLYIYKSDIHGYTVAQQFYYHVKHLYNCDAQETNTPFLLTVQHNWLADGTISRNLHII